MAKLTKHDKKSIEKSMAVPAERGPVWNRRPVVFADKRRTFPQKRKDGMFEGTSQLLKEVSKNSEEDKLFYYYQSDC